MTSTTEISISVNPRGALARARFRGERDGAVDMRRLCRIALQPAAGPRRAVGCQAGIENRFSRYRIPRPGDPAHRCANPGNREAGAMRHGPTQQGMIPGVLAVLVAIGIASVLGAGWARQLSALKRDRISDAALAKAREALVGYATSRPIDNIVGPGYLPCPDLDDDGWAEATCGSQSGDIGQAERLGRLPWKTLGLDDLRDGHGERLWYAVSSKYKGLLNCTVSTECLDMSPDAALGTITVRDPTGAIVHDGTSTNLLAPGRGGAAAVIIAPGAALSRDGRMQDRGCTGGACNDAGHCTTKPASLTPRCNPVNYLDRATGNGLDEDNAAFVDRNDAAGRRRNSDGFLRGPVFSAAGNVVVNDRIAAIGYDDIMPGMMLRVAQEVALCLREYAAQPRNRSRYPWPAPPCHQRSPDPAVVWSDAENVLFGRVPDAPFRATLASSAGAMLGTWTGTCALADAASPGWWDAWRWHVFYALGAAVRPQAGMEERCSDDASCLQALDGEGHPVPPGKAFAVLVAGAPMATAALVQSHGPLALADPRHWLEGPNAELRAMNPDPASRACASDPPQPACRPLSSCNRVAAARDRHRNDVVLAWP
jgi:hypothetical protein